MRLIEGIFCKICHLIKYLIGYLLAYASVYTTRYIFFFIAIYKVLAFLKHYISFFLGHGTSNQITSSESISGKLHNYLHNLLLIYDTAIGWCKDFFQCRMVINNLIRMLLTLDIKRYKIHRTRSVKRYTGYNVLYIGRL